jgi:hypothetical protein
MSLTGGIGNTIVYVTTVVIVVLLLFWSRLGPPSVAPSAPGPQSQA